MIPVPGALVVMHGEPGTFVFSVRTWDDMFHAGVPGSVAATVITVSMHKSDAWPATYTCNLWSPVHGMWRCASSRFRVVWSPVQLGTAGS